MCEWSWFWRLGIASLSGKRSQGAPALVHVHSRPSAQAGEQAALLAVYSMFDKLCSVARQISMWCVHTAVFKASKAGIQAQSTRATSCWQRPARLQPQEKIVSAGFRQKLLLPVLKLFHLLSVQQLWMTNKLSRYCALRIPLSSSHQYDSDTYLRRPLEVERTVQSHL